MGEVKKRPPIFLADAMSQRTGIRAADFELRINEVDEVAVEALALKALPTSRRLA